MNQQEIEILLADLKIAREKAAFYRDETKAIIENAKQSPNYQLADQSAREAADLVANLEAKIKESALADFKVDGNKHPFPKIEIKMRKVFKVVDPARVLAWVKTSLADALVYDEKKVKDYATKIGPVEGTELTEEAQVQIASEL